MGRIWEILDLGRSGLANLGQNGSESPESVAILDERGPGRVQKGPKMAYFGVQNGGQVQRAPRRPTPWIWGPEWSQYGPGMGVASGGGRSGPYNKTFARARVRGIY